MLNSSICRPSLTVVGSNKISTIKCIREHLHVGLKEAKDIADMKAPLPSMTQVAAQSLISDLRKIGADASIWPSHNDAVQMEIDAFPPSTSTVSQIVIQRNGAMFEVRIQHDGLRAFRIIKGQNRLDVQLKAQIQVAVWEKKWSRQQEANKNRSERLSKAYSEQARKQVALERTRDAEAQVQALSEILASCKQLASSVWDELRDRSVFSVPPPAPPVAAENPAMPTEANFAATLGFLDRLVRSRREKKQQQSRNDFWTAKEQWEANCRVIESSNKIAHEVYDDAIAKWNIAKRLHSEEAADKNARVEELRSLFLEGNSQAVEFYNLHVLLRSEYPASFPKDANLQFSSETGVLVVDYELPNPQALPAIKEVKYIARRGEFQEVPLSESWLKRTYDDVLYSVCLRTTYELYVSDYANHIRSIVFNGWVTSTDRSNGAEAHACIISLQTTKDEYLAINLPGVEPKACFKKLKGVSASKLLELTPVRPLIVMNMEDDRFVSPYGMVDEIDERTNLAAMDWMDFENLIREIFEKEFSQHGGVVKITQASRDGGVDAIAFDPDPIRGGKIVIQAKRYTNTVGVSAVRDLYGTVHNEGATKGILVTTSDFGPDAHAFAQGKPITLLNGSELLYLLQRHGHSAKIDIREAKLLSSNERSAT